ncbi:MAG TPA: histidine kinase dimerization/phosphoacceptor domain -containing protein [Chitinophagaceae bacterium]|nr:histidine kinase dimerization/phosphoacceptor domain -containing protein [Chitinophagaceae bacterium]
MRRLFIIASFIIVTARAYTQDLILEDRNRFLTELKKAATDSARISLLLKLAQYYIIPIYDHSSNLDSARRLLAQAEELNRKAASPAGYGQILLTKSYYLRTTGKREEGKKFILAAIEHLKKAAEYHLLGQSYYELSNYYDYDFKLATVNQRIAYIDTAITAFEKSKSYNDLGNSYKVLADLDHLINQYAKAFREIRKSLEYYKITHYKRLEGVYDLFGQLNYARGAYKEALGYQLLALKISNNNDDYGPQLAQIENNVGLTFYKLNDLHAAIAHFKNALQIAAREKDNETVYGLAVQVVDAYVELKQPREALDFFKSIESKYKLPEAEKWNTRAYIYNMYLNLYCALKRYDIARFYCDKLIAKTKDPTLDVYRLTFYYTGIIKYFIAVRDFTNGLLYLNKNKEVLTRIDDALGLASNYNLWFSLDTAQGNYRSAVHNLVSANFIRDTIFNAAKTAEIKKLEVEYEYEKKENDIRLKGQEITVLKQADLLRQANLDKAMAIRNATLIATIILLALAAILYNQYKEKKKANILVTKRNEQLGSLLREKEWLLKEVHHRVKNNLHTVICLLESQAAYLENDALKAIENSQHRIYAMSLIHQKLYQSEDVKTINMAVYLPEFIYYLKESFDTDNRIQFAMAIDSIHLGVSQAIPIALIINEALTNAIKYAFPGNQRGVIKVSMKETSGRVVLEIADNGIGFDNALLHTSSESLGLKLISGLSADINADLAFSNDNGTTITIVFNVDLFHNNIDQVNIMEKKMYA